MSMRYQGSQRKNKLSINRVLDIVTYSLVIIIAFFFNYMLVNFLFR